MHYFSHLLDNISLYFFFFKSLSLSNCLLLNMKKAKVGKNLAKIFVDFLKHVEDYINENILLGDKVKILYLQKPQLNILGLESRGVVKIGDRQYILEVWLNSETQQITISSRAFVFALDVKDAKKYLKLRENFK